MSRRRIDRLADDDRASSEIGKIPRSDQEGTQGRPIMQCFEYGGCRRAQEAGGRSEPLDQALCRYVRFIICEGAKDLRQLGYGPQRFSRRMWATNPHVCDPIMK